MYSKGIFSGLLVTVLFFAATSLAAAKPQDPNAPLTPHCVGSGPLPLDPDFCGCTWGAIYYRGEPIFNAPVSLHFGDQATSTVSKSYDNTQPTAYYTLTGAGMGAKKGDIMTVTVAFAGQTLARAFRAWPDETKEQEVALVLPEQGIWTPWLTGGYTRTVTIADHTLWAGGPAGLLAVDLTSKAQVTHALPWSEPTVVSLALAPNGHVWAAGPHTLAEFDGSTWQNHTPPFSATIRTLAADPTTGAIWLGGGDNSDALAVYDGNWQTVTAVAEEIRSLAIDETGNVWVGTWGGGAYRHDHAAGTVNSGWQQYKVKAGLASDYILTIAAKATDVWFGTQPYVDGQGTRGGVSHYSVGSQTWHTYTSMHGLPADTLGAAAPIYAVALDGKGVPWIGTPQGVQLLAAPETWANDIVTGNAVRALTVVDDIMIAARASGHLLRLDQNITPGNPPTAQITSANALTVTQVETFTLTARATDNDSNSNETRQQILAWDWLVDGQPLCTTATVCTMPAEGLSIGTHTISLRVQDDEGVWSQPVITTLAVTQADAVYLPVIKAAPVTHTAK